VQQSIGHLFLNPLCLLSLFHWRINLRNQIPLGSTFNIPTKELRHIKQTQTNTVDTA